MKTVIYLDVLLAVNFVTALFLLAGCGVLCSARSRPLRLTAASGLAAAASLILLAPELPLWGQVLYQAASALAIVRTAFCWQGRRVLLRLCGWYFVLNLALAGLVVLAAYRGCEFVHTNNLACYFGISPLLLLGCVAGIYFLLRVLVLCFGRPAALPGRHLRLTLAGGAPQPVEAFYDTGFAVQDPATGRPVLLLYYSAVRGGVPEALRFYLDAVFSPPGSGRLPVPPPGAQVRLLACDTVAGRTLLPAVPAWIQDDIGTTAVFAAGPPADRRIEALFGPDLAHKLQGRIQDATYQEPDRAGS